MIRRRGFLAGLLAAPAIIRTPGLLMPVRPVLLGMDMGRDEGNWMFISNPPTGESVFFRLYMEELAKRRVRPFEGGDGKFYVALQGDDLPLRIGGNG